MDFNLTQEQYESLVALARRGVEGDAQKILELDAWLRQIESANGVTRSFLWIQWQEKSAPLPQGTRFPEVWPERLRRSIELVTRPIARADVDAVLNQYANDPIEILVTADPNATLGWTPVDDYFIT